MKNNKAPKPQQRSVRAVLRAAVVGAALFDGMIVLANLMDSIWRHGNLSEFWNSVFTLISYALAVPSVLVTNAIGFKPVLVNAYLVNGLLGAVTFGVIEWLWQLLKKGSHEQYK